MTERFRTKRVSREEVDNFWAASPKPELEADLVNRCREDAEAMDVYLEVAGQRKAKGSGTTIGFPDAILYASGHVVPVEFKRFEDGRISKAQAAAILKRERQGIATRIIRTEDEFVALVNRCRGTAR